jgi:2-polyprenyl-6-methoxyphenol hydroxylase-like FAD-dependent oxidoreductase
VLVIGGGPAGCASASLLARWGHSVTLIAKPAGQSADLGESIPPSTRKLFELLGVRAAIEAAPFVPSTGNTVWWGSDAPRVELFTGMGHGWQATSASLGAILVEHARQSGVQIAWVRAETPAIALDSAAFVLDCTGRTGLLARGRGLRRYDSRYRTVAMVGVWRREGGFGLPDPSHTLIESYDGGWAWSVPRSPQERFVAVMVDPRATATLSGDMTRLTPELADPKRGPAGPSSAGLALYREQLNRTRHIKRIVVEGALTTGPTGFDASMYHAARYVDGNLLLVGDAASFLDPLSSAGIKKALASGWLAAVAIHTALTKPAMRDTALAFFAAREAEVYASFRAMTERFFSEAAAGHAHPFWSDRRDEPASPADRLATEAAFERLRQAPELRLVRGTGTIVEPRPAVRGAEIVLEPHLVSGDQDAAIRFAFDVDLLALIDLATAYTSVPGLFAAYNERHAPVALPDFLAALATVLARNWLVWL